MPLTVRRINLNNVNSLCVLPMPMKPNLWCTTKKNCVAVNCYEYMLRILVSIHREKTNFYLFYSCTPLQFEPFFPNTGSGLFFSSNQMEVRLFNPCRLAFSPDFREAILSCLLTETERSQEPSLHSRHYPASCTI